MSDADANRGRRGAVPRRAPRALVVVVAVVAVAASVLAATVASRHLKPRTVGAAGPRPTPARVTVTPSTHLVRGQRVLVGVTGFPAGAKVFLSECATAADVNPAGCRPQLAAQSFLGVDDHGRGTGSFAVSPVVALHAYDPGDTVLCTRTCVLMATTGLLPPPRPRVVAYTRIDFTSLPSSSRPGGTSDPRTLPFSVLRRIPLGFDASTLVTAGTALFALSARERGAATAVVARIDPETGRVGPRVRVGDAIDMAAGGGVLWVLEGTRVAGSDRAVGAPELVGYDLATLAVTHTVRLGPAMAGGVGYAGGLMWVSRLDGLTAVDPAAATVVRTTRMSTCSSCADPVALAASADGTALWTSEPVARTAKVSVQLRDPRTGRIRASAAGVGDCRAGARIAAADDHAWLTCATGMMGSYTRVDVDGDRLVAVSRQVGEGVAEFTNAVATRLVGDRLWALDGQTATVADDATGQPLARASFITDDQTAVAGLRSGALALASDRTVLIARPRPIDPQAYAAGVREVDAFLADWRRDGLAAAARRYLAPGEQPAAGTATPVLADGHVVLVNPYTWSSNDHFTLLMGLRLHFGGDAGAYTDGLDSRYVTFDRRARDAPFVLTIATGP